MKNYEYPDMAEIYDAAMETYVADFDFYMEEAQSARGPVLEVACGTGRLLIPMMERGVDVYGVDISKPMLSVLKEKADAKGLHPKVFCGDMRTFRLDMQFALIIVPFRSFNHLETTDDQIEALRNFHRHLRDDGKLTLNFFHPCYRIIAESRAAPRLHNEFINPHTGRMVKVWDVHRRDFIDQFAQYERIYEELDDNGCVVERRYRTFTIRWIFKAEFELLLQLAGFSHWMVYGGFHREPLTQDDQEMVWMAWK